MLALKRYWESSRKRLGRKVLIAQSVPGRSKKNEAFFGENPQKKAMEEIEKKQTCHLIQGREHREKEKGGKSMFHGEKEGWGKVKLVNRLCRKDRFRSAINGEGKT